MFSLPTWVAKTFSTMWVRNDGNIHPCLVPTFQVEAVWFFTTECDASSWAFYRYRSLLSKWGNVRVFVAFWEFCFFFKHFLCLCWHAHVFFPPLFHWSCESCWFIFICHTNLTFWYKPFLVKIYYPFIYRQTPFAKTLWSFPIYVMTRVCRCTLFPCDTFVWFC